MARSCPRTGGRRTRASAPCWRPSPAPCVADILDGTWSPPVSDGSGRDRALLRRALGLFTQAGYELRGTELVERKSGRPLTFEIMVTARSDAMDEERMALLFAGQLKRAGITVRLRPVDAVQFEARRIAFDFDMISNRWDQSLSPGNEQAFYWSSEAAEFERQPQLHGREEPGDRRHDRRPAQIAGPRRRGRGRSRARSRADVGVLHSPVVPSTGSVDCALDKGAASRSNLPVGTDSRNLVAEPSSAQ